MSRAALAERLGVTFQQVQKYEKGMNRVGAGAAHEDCCGARVPVSELLGDDGAGQNNRRGLDETRSPLKLLTAPGALKLLRAYARINDRHQRRNIVAVIERIASGPGKSK